MESAAPSYKGHRYPVEIISHCVWLYFRFPLSFREVEELMLERGVVVSYETIRRWCAKFGQDYANRLCRRRRRPGDTWHMDEVFIKINGVIHYLWRAVDQDGNVLDILVQPRRNAKAAKKFFRRLLKELEYVPRVIVTDRLRSYDAAHRTVMPSVEHRSSKYLNNRAENSHQPTRQRERTMRRRELFERVVFAQVDQGAPSPIVRTQCAEALPIAGDDHHRHQLQQFLIKVACGRISRHHPTHQGYGWKGLQQLDNALFRGFRTGSAGWGPRRPGRPSTRVRVSTVLQAGSGTCRGRAGCWPGSPRVRRSKPGCR
ncbi:IS6 family transposase [Streptomyces noursei]|uniref:IS6 family transposase n=1 Tax=Streptomyces noursei TaxID=1971 RepID=UPI0022A6ED9E|nr:IS6 family transposase [Streptomyces noursei]MCZ1021249.1 IS6 family transposase [Streptomyces noursei]